MSNSGRVQCRVFWVDLDQRRARSDLVAHGVTACTNAGSAGGSGSISRTASTPEVLDLQVRAPYSLSGIGPIGWSGYRTQHFGLAAAEVSALKKWEHCNSTRSVTIRSDEDQNIPETSVAARGDLELRNIEFPFQSVKSVVTDFLALPKAVERLASMPKHLEAERTLIRPILRLLYNAFFGG